MSTYTKPGNIKSPKRHWQLFHVLFDGGAEDNPKAVELGMENSTASLAIGRWDGRPALAMRWNGTAEKPIGNPQSRGLPTWFIVPDHYVQPILEASGFSHSKLKFARDFLELRRVYFLSRCPTPGCTNFGELTLGSYESEKLPKYRQQLDRDALPFYCIFCDEAWYPTPDEKRRLTEDMDKGWKLYLEKVQGHS